MALASKATPAVRQHTIQRRKRDANSAPIRKRTANRSALAFGLLLLAGTIALYLPVRANDFVNYDDKDYVLTNSHVTSGLTWDNVRWALTACEQSNWHPLTWLSHALDCQLFGLNASGHHLMNLGIHVMNVLLLFLLLYKATGAVGRSFLVAALFAWHPFNVQSVAWIAERKNLLSTFLFLLTLGAYAWYAQKPGWKRMCAVAGIFVLALASKPMVVTLPIVLLLLDYWPLQRVKGWTDLSSRLSIPQQTVARLLLEKLPLLCLSIASSAITVWAQRSGGALRSLHTFSFGTRLSNALHSYGMYIWKTFWPSGLAVYYPLAGTRFPLWKLALVTLFLCAISVMAWIYRKSRPYLAVGWMWFQGTLVPVIGIVQVGDQAMADRYAYLPLIGLFTLVIWAISDVFDLRRIGRAPRWGLTAIALGISCFLTLQQFQYWQNSVTLWTRAYRITSGDLQIEKQLANALVDSGETEQALPYLVHIASIDPSDTTVRANLGTVYAAHGQLPEATHEFEAVISLTTHENLSSDDRKFRASIFLNLGFAYTRSNDYPKALKNFEDANRFDPAMVDQIAQGFNASVSDHPSESGYLTLSLLLLAKGKTLQATSILESAIQASPEYASARDFLGYLKAGEQ